MSDAVLIVGGAGFVGSTTAWLLADQGYPVHILDNLSQGYRELAGAGPLHVADLRDPAALEALFASQRIRAVLHFAAFIAVGESVREPLAYYQNNIAGTLNLLNVMARHDVRRLVFSSTAAVYGEPERVPILESASLAPVNPYGWSKRMMEQIFADCDRAWGLKTLALRYFNASGAEARGRCGEWHRPETHLIPVTLRAMTGQAEPLTVFGEDYPTPDGTCVRDYVHVSDLAQAHVLALEHLMSGGESTAYNLGSERGFSVREVIETVERVTGRRVPHRLGPRREGDPATLVASSQAIQRALGWKPAHSDLESIVRDAWAWHEAHGFCGEQARG